MFWVQCSGKGTIILLNAKLMHSFLLLLFYYDGKMINFVDLFDNRTA